ncbi:hypothetical protein DFH07DRAFT_766396 [Mycena maculata]|uniref:Uncharacterized protein n=1 Tax=Mycena maculata TaxID=230809 RepID=A0AAD7K426_9AGAR|nr:hypothetical protein DFH07DRAFT_766396 [Mycena maculata]
MFQKVHEPTLLAEDDHLKDLNKVTQEWWHRIRQAEQYRVTKPQYRLVRVASRTTEQRLVATLERQRQSAVNSLHRVRKRSRPKRHGIPIRGPFSGPGDRTSGVHPSTRVRRGAAGFREKIQGLVMGCGWASQEPIQGTSDANMEGKHTIHTIRPPWLSNEAAKEGQRVGERWEMQRKEERWATASMRPPALDVRHNFCEHLNKRQRQKTAPPTKTLGTRRWRMRAEEVRRILRVEPAKMRNNVPSATPANSEKGTYGAI